MILMESSKIRAVLFDLDGTLYDQSRLRSLMVLELCTLPFRVRSWSRVCSTLRIIRCFRSIREDLRDLGCPADQALVELQYVQAGERAGVEAAEVERVITEWMYHRPLKYLKWCRRQGVKMFFAEAAQRGMNIGVFSDYPVKEKLEALGLSKYVQLLLCATDKDINAFKPHPCGFLKACEHWGLRPDEVLYVGDRPEVDAKGAGAAGMPCVIVNGKDSQPLQDGPFHQSITLASFRGLHHVLTTHC